jgi:hypothetical protein
MKSRLRCANLRCASDGRCAIGWRGEGKAGGHGGGGWDGGCDGTVWDGMRSVDCGFDISRWGDRSSFRRPCLGVEAGDVRHGVVC